MDYTGEMRIVTELLDGVGRHAITQYTQWFLIESIVGVIIGVALVALDIILFRIGFRNITEWWESGDEFLAVITVGAIFSCGALAVYLLISNIPTLINPEAYAIHQLLTDITGK